MKCTAQEEKHDNKIIYKELSYEIVAAALEVHKSLGPGFTENIYEEALCRELHSRGIAFQRQFSVVVQYKGEDVGRYQLDMVVDGKIVIELKAASQVLDQFEHQLHTYLKASGKKLGILFNFGAKSLDYRRIAK